MMIQANANHVILIVLNVKALLLLIALSALKVHFYLLLIVDNAKHVLALVINA